MRVFGQFLMLLLLPVFGMAQLLEFKASTTKQSYAINEKFKLEFKLNASGTGFQGPELDAFKVITGPNVSTSLSYVNGEMSGSTTNSYLLQPTRAGNFIIGSALISVNGKNISSEPIIITVTSDSVEVTASGMPVEAAKITDTSFLFIDVSRTTLGMDDLVAVSYQLFTTANAVSLDEIDFAVPEGMWVEETSGTEVKTSQQTIKGKEFKVYDLKTYTMQPIRSGMTPVGPFSLTFTYKYRTDRKKGESMFDSFFGSYEDSTISLTSEAVELEVTSKAHDAYGKTSAADFMDLMNARPREQKGVPHTSVVFLVDVSLSNYCKDFEPDRLAAMRKFLHNLIKENRGSMVAVIPFSSEALDFPSETMDMVAVGKKIDSLDYSELGEGTSIGMGLYSAIKALYQNVGQRTIVLISDGDSNVGHLSPITAAEVAAKHGIRIDAISLGKDEEVECVTTRTYEELEFVKYIPQVNTELLTRLTSMTGGKYFHAEDSAALKALESNVHYLLD